MDERKLKMLPDLLLPWFSGNARDLPWRKDREPYHVWLSEIMLQQTRVEAVRQYYLRFLAEIPDIPSLASAPPERLNKLWEGLGYYSRVRNMQSAAQDVAARFGGVFPDRYEDVLSLRGIGAYTAGAICSICFEQPVPAVDGNVLRVFCRYTADSSPVNDPKTVKSVRDALSAVYPHTACGSFTQALMELGATVCVPNGAPACERCPLREHCASSEGGWQRLPVKKAKPERRTEQLTVLLMRHGDRVAVRKRPHSGLLADMWEFPNIPGDLNAAEAVAAAERLGVHPADILLETRETHVFTHITWQMRGWYLTCSAEPDCFVWADRAQIENEIALPTAFRKFRKDIFQ